MPAETLIADEWLYTVLSGDVTLAGLVGTHIYNQLAPEEAALPLVLFAFQSGRDVPVMGPSRLFLSGTYLVRGVAESHSFGGNLETIAGRIDALLQAKSGTPVRGKVLMCVREAPFAMTEQRSGRIYRYLGGMYRIWAQS